MQKILADKEVTTKADVTPKLIDGIFALKVDDHIKLFNSLCKLINLAQKVTHQLLTLWSD